MSSVCGIIDYDSSTFSFDKLNAMAKATKPRGPDRSGAYIKGGVGIQYNGAVFTGKEKNRQPFSLTREGHDFVLTFDGEIRNLKEISERLGLLGELCDEEILLEGYIAFGNDLFSLIDGSFALVIYDSRRKELIVARDKRGAKPLFYTSDGRAFLFASSIKALLASGIGCFEADIAAIREFILSDLGTMRGSDLYRDIDELPEGCFVTFSRLGTSVCDYKGKTKENRDYAKETSTADIPASISLSEALSASLFAFDHPSFDEYTQSYISALMSVTKGKRITIEDPTVMLSERYALERADRLGALYGLSLTPTHSENSLTAKKRELRQTEKKLTELVGKLFVSDSAIRSVLGDSFFEKILNEKDILRRVRALGMTYQTKLWTECYSVIPV